MVKEFSAGADIKMRITMKNSDRNHPGVYNDCDPAESPFGLDGWVSFWDNGVMLLVPLDQVDKMEMYKV
jgi:hypothetical protein